MNKELEKIIAESDSVMGEIMKGAHIDKSRKSRSFAVIKTKQYARKQARSDVYLKVCDKCNYVWEREFNSWRISSQVSKYICRYDEIPKYKKPIETCPICLGVPNVRETRIY